MYWIAGGIWMCNHCGLKKPCKCDRGGENLMERYYTEKREKAEEQERYVSGLEEENKRLREENEVLKCRNAELEQYIERIENVAHWEGGEE